MNRAIIAGAAIAITLAAGGTASSLDGSKDPVIAEVIGYTLACPMPDLTLKANNAIANAPSHLRQHDAVFALLAESKELAKAAMEECYDTDEGITVYIIKEDRQTGTACVVSTILPIMDLTKAACNYVPATRLKRL